MRRRSERKKSTEVVQSPSPAVKSSRKTRQSTQNEALLNLHKNGEIVSNKIEHEEPKLQSKSIKSLLDSNNGSSEALNEEPKPNTIKEQKLEVIEEVQTENENIQNEKTNKDKTEKCESDEKELSPTPTGALKETQTEINKTNEEGPSSKVPIEETIDSVQKEKEITEKEAKSRSDTAQNKNNQKNNEDEVEENSKDTELEKAKNNSPEKTEIQATGCETTKNLGRHKEGRTQIVLRNNEQENDENDELNPSNEGTKVTRKRRWLSKKTSGSTSQVLAISTDSLKNLISDVKPVPLSDIKLESSSDVEEVDSEREEVATPVVVLKSKPPENSSSLLDKERLIRKKYENPTRKVAVFNDDRPPVIPTKKETSSILCIKNLVRPFTVLQLKGLLARTGKIVEDRFWIDKIKSKCYVQYETEDQAVETRHALHGVRWPTSNPKCLSVDFGTAAEMDKVMSSSHDTVAQVGQEVGRENLVVGTGWDRDRDRFEFEEKKIAIGRPVREWDVGKREELEIEADLARKREKMRGGERNERIVLKDGADKERRNEERNVRNSDRKRRSSDPERRRSLSASPARKIKKKSNDPPLRLLDDLFRKTKTTPCIYWLPLTPEQIAEKEAFRLRRVAEHQERIKQRELEKQKDREREREKERGRRREGYRSNGRRRSNT